MPSYFGLWKVNPSIQPLASPQDQVTQAKAFAGMLAGQMKAGIVKEAHAFVEGNAGYFITGDLPDETQFENFTMWAPYVTFELHRTVAAPKFLDLFVSAIQKRSGQS